jgi:hypothetical protein
MIRGRTSARALWCALLLLGSGCGGTSARDRDDEDPPSTSKDAGKTSDGGGSEEDGGVADGGDENDGGVIVVLPSVTVTTPGSSSGEVHMTFRLYEEASAPLSVEVKWSEDNGATWKTPTLATSTSELASSPEGVEHELVWMSATDVPDRQASVKLRLTPSSATQTGHPASTDTFTVDNRSLNTAPGVVWGNVPNPVQQDASISFLVADAEADSLTVTVQYNDGSGWKAATFNPAAPSSFPSSLSGIEHTLVWASGSDIQDDVASVQLRIQVDDGKAKSPWVGSASFEVKNAAGSHTGVQITEVSAGGTENWFELENFGSQSYDLRGWKLKYTAEPYGWTWTLPDASTQQTPITLAPGARLLLTAASGTSTSSTVYLGYNFGWTSGNSGSLELLDNTDVPIDFVRWGGSTANPDPGTGWSEPKRVYLPHDSASLKRRTTTDHDSASDFCACPATKGSANTSACYPEASASSKVHMVEISSAADNPTPSPSSAPQWVELLNSGSSTDLTNWVITTSYSNIQKSYVLRTVTIGQNGRLVVRSAASGSDTTGVQYAGSGALALRPGQAGWILLSDPSGQPIDFLRWGGSIQEPPLPRTFTEASVLTAPEYTVTLARQPENSTDQSASSWCTTNPSPSATNTACVTPPVTQVLINEVATGAANLCVTPNIAFIEIINAGSTYVSIENWRLRYGSVSTSDYYTITETTPLAPGARRAYYESPFCGTLPSGATTLGTLPWGQVTGNSGDSGFIELLDNSATRRSMDFMRWGAATATPTGTGGAWTEPPVLGPLSGVSGARAYGRREQDPDTNKASDYCFQAASGGTANTICR